MACTSHGPVLDLLQRCSTWPVWIGRRGACPSRGLPKSTQESAFTYSGASDSYGYGDVSVLAGLDFNLVAALGGDFWTWLGQRRGDSGQGEMSFPQYYARFSTDLCLFGVAGL